MENKINIAKLLKNCPTGMELDCLIYDNMYFKCIREHAIYPIVCYTIDSKGEKEEITFTWYGKYALTDTAKCVIFPKGRNTWKGFDPYYQFKNGDVVATNTGAWIGITTGGDSRDLVPTHCVIKGDGTFAAYLDIKNTWCFSRLATEEEKQKLFNAIKENGYRWNAETKTLDKLVKPEFNAGDWIIRNNKYTGIPVKVIEFDGCYSCELNGEVVNLTLNDVHNNFHLWTIQDAKDGDVLFHSDSASNGIFIFKEILQRGTLQKVMCHCDYDSEDGFCLGENYTCCYTDSKILRPATKEQCNLLFQKIKKAGYKWNPETNVLEKLPKFKDGDIIADEHGNIAIYKGTMWYNKKLAGYYCGYRKSDNHFLPEPKRDGHFGLIEELHHPTEEEKQKLFDIIRENKYSWNTETKTLEKLPKFKVGDRVKGKYTNNIHTISVITSREYWLTNGKSFTFDDEDCFELVLDKFDINTLIPFESRVLVRDNESDVWRPAIFGCKFKNREYPFYTMSGCYYKQCIPYEENEHLCGKTDDCQDFYKTWK